MDLAVRMRWVSIFHPTCINCVAAEARYLTSLSVSLYLYKGDK